MGGGGGPGGKALHESRRTTLDPQHSYKKPSVVVHIPDPSMGTAKTGDPRGLLTSQPSLVDEAQVPVMGPSQKQGRMTQGASTQILLHVLAHAHIHAHT